MSEVCISRALQQKDVFSICKYIKYAFRVLVTRYTRDKIESAGLTVI